MEEQLEIWKQIKEFPLYEVSNLGRIKKTKGGRIINGEVTKNGLKIAKLTNKEKNKRVGKSIKILVATYFCENPNNYKNVLNIDGNQLNVKSDNLKWSVFKNNTVDLKTIYDSVPLYRYEDVYKITKEGIIIRIDGNIIENQYPLNGYMGMTLTDSLGKKHTEYIHRLLMETYNPIENMEEMIVDHIDGNRQNYDLKNLRWVTKHSNSLFRKENQIDVYTIVQKRIEKFGYMKVVEYLEKM